MAVCVINQETRLEALRGSDLLSPFTVKLRVIDFCMDLWKLAAVLCIPLLHCVLLLPVPSLNTVLWAFEFLFPYPAIALRICILNGHHCMTCPRPAVG